MTRMVKWLLAGLLLIGASGSSAQASACAGLRHDDCARLHNAWRSADSARFTLDVELEIREARSADLARFYVAGDGVYHLRAGDMQNVTNLLEWASAVLTGVRLDVDLVTPGAGRPLPLNVPQDESAWQLRLVDGVGYGRWLLPAADESDDWYGVDLGAAGVLLALIPGLDGLQAWFAGTPPPAELFNALGSTRRLPDVRLDRQKAAVYETTFDLGQILADESNRADVVALLFEVARLAAVPRQYSTGGLLRSAGYIADALSTASLRVTQVIGLDDSRLHHVALSASFTPGSSRTVDPDDVRIDPDPLGLIAVLPYDFRLDAVLTLGGFDTVPAALPVIEVPADAILIPLPALLAPQLRGAPL